MLIQQFRKAVYQSLRKRADASIDLVDALTVAGHLNSPVALSEETPFRRKFSSIFDSLLHAELDFDLLLQVLLEYQPNSSLDQPAGQRSVPVPVAVPQRLGFGFARRWLVWTLKQKVSIPAKPDCARFPS